MSKIEWGGGILYKLYKCLFLLPNIKNLKPTEILVIKILGTTNVFKYLGIFLSNIIYIKPFIFR